MHKKVIKTSLAILALSFFPTPAAHAQAQDAPPTNSVVRILLNCPTTCKPGDQEIILPKDLLKPLTQPVKLSDTPPPITVSDTYENAVRQFVGVEPKLPTENAKSYFYNPEPVYHWVNTEVTKLVRGVQEPKFVMDRGMVKEFLPAQSGIKIDARRTTLAILQGLQDNKTDALATAEVTAPSKQLGDTNDLGITELIGRGESNFSGSPKNRRHNIDVGVTKLRGTILSPGEVFSFNENICPVEKTTGYLPELVIKADEGTIPEYGGGLCQVSSTTYRAAMNSGLEIVQRKNHSYAVQYYAPQGSDATTYCGGVDFQFRNDTANSILIWPYLKDKNNLVFDFYGTKDGRTVELPKPTTYDRKSDGSMKATWTRKVTKNGVTKEDVFKSVYLPPALFHKEEAATGTTASTTTVPNPTTKPTPSPTPPASGVKED